MGQKRSPLASGVPYLGFCIFLFLLIWVPNTFEPVIRNDHNRNIEIPEKLLHEMRVKVAYNEDTAFFRFELPTPEPSWYHDYWIYQGNGQWHRQGRSPVGREPERLYEDRISFFLDDGGVPEFSKWGGFITASGREMRFFTHAASQEVREHPYLGAKGQSDLRKWLPETRTDPHDWRTIKPEEELMDLRRAGYFLDLWQWRSHRSNPIGWSDDQYILDYRWSDEGTGMYTTNWDEEKGQPRFMFDPEKTGQYAMRWEKVQQQGYGQQDMLRYALILGNERIEGNTLAFDVNHDWQVGDVIPRRLLRVPSGSRGSIHANGIYKNGNWEVDLWRALDTGAELDDKTLRHQGMYQVAFAAHILSTGSRWHYVSFPKTLGLSRHADIVAVHFEGSVPPWEQIPWTTLTLFYPGQINWSYLISPAHAGAKQIAAGKPLWEGHDEQSLARYAVQNQFRQEIRRQWVETLSALVFTLILFSVATILVAPRSNGLKPREEER
ncbi:ethylbenzene dehydrogenase-related protein [Desulfobotulus sp.]|uniref:ethylbenzene dehydrogenase-related protein n=1 Tax=Desulfobotulus sp. TaxID=1940337 RepID=UPI002A36CD91|nr:ethylbenzene dehydrogenase-related protein [Desulfobotulus sp.]MDY0164155.1 ethylbenzene dehydrogenase-related protein [Desulfobotulus sp.]